jgi:hypothetical protein
MHERYSSATPGKMLGCFPVSVEVYHLWKSCKSKALGPVASLLKAAAPI